MAQEIKQKLEIDFTGKNGLMDNFFGDYDNLPQTPDKNVYGQPYRRYGIPNGQMSSGIYNPFKKNGYLSPADITLENITIAASAPTNIYAASKYDEINNNTYFLEEFILSTGIRLAQGTGFEDTDLSEDKYIVASGAYGTDLEIYTVYGERTLFYGYVNYGTVGYIGRKSLSASAITYTANAATDVITVSGSSTFKGQNGRRIRVSATVSTPGGLNDTTDYYIINTNWTSGSSSWTCQLALTSGGAAINITSTGTGVQSISLFDDNFISNAGAVSGTFTPNGESPIKMITSGDGFMYILNVNNVHRFDGTIIGGVNGTIYQNILSAPEYYRFTGGIEYKSNMFLILHQAPSYGALEFQTTKIINNCGIYLWNKQASFFNSSQYIPITGVREIRRIWVTEKDEVMLMAVGGDGYNYLYKYNGSSSFTKIKKLPYYSEVPFDDSLTVTPNGTIWLGRDSHIWCWGTAPNASTPGLFCIGDINTVSQGTVNDAGTIDNGVILYGATSTNFPESLILSYSPDGNSNYKFGRFYVDYNGGTTVSGGSIYNSTGKIATSAIPLPYMSTVKHLDIFMDAGQTGGTTIQAQIKFYKNQQPTAFMTKYITRDDIKKGYISFEINQPYVNNIQFEIGYYNTTTTPPSGSTPVSAVCDFSPSYGVLYYVPTSQVSK